MEETPKRESIVRGLSLIQIGDCCFFQSHIWIHLYIKQIPPINVKILWVFTMHIVAQPPQSRYRTFSLFRIFSHSSYKPFSL